MESYQKLQSPRIVDEGVFAQLLNGISMRKYEKAVEKIPETFGISKSSISRKFIQAAAEKLKALHQRDLSDEDFVAIFMDGKSFAENEMIIALGITLQGEKLVLGMVESSTENHLVCQAFLQSLKQRGLRDENKLLFIIDGAKGLRKGIRKVFGRQLLDMVILRKEKGINEASLPDGMDNQKRLFFKQGTLRKGILEEKS